MKPGDVGFMVQNKIGCCSRMREIRMSGCNGGFNRSTPLKKHIVDIPREHSGEFRFVIVKVDDKYVLRARKEGAHHTIAVDVLESLAPDSLDKVRVLSRGGGFVRINENQRRIEVFGKSSDYGAPPYDLVERLLKPYASSRGYDLLVQMDEREVLPLVLDLWEGEK